MGRREQIDKAVRHLAPRIPRHEFAAVVDHALDSRGLATASPEAAAWLSLVAYVRHVHTEYDTLLDQGYDHDSARFFVRAEMEAILQQLGVRRPLALDD